MVINGNKIVLITIYYHFITTVLQFITFFPYHSTFPFAFTVTFCVSPVA